MKKILILLMMIFTTDSFASGIASNTASAPCTNSTLETYSGNSNLAADWQPNEIQLRWYNNNTLMNVQSSANTCVYDGSLTVPSTAPTRTGYTFAGWEVRPEMDFSTISVENVVSGYGKDAGGGTGWCAYTVDGAYHRDSRQSCTETREFNDLQYSEWKIQFNAGWLYGMSKCSAKSGNTYNWNINYKSYWTATYDELESATGDKRYCWCKPTGFRPNNENTFYAPSNNLLWVLNSSSISLEGDNICSWVCAIRCYARSYDESRFRSVLISQ